ncbi:flavodoxin domain-containing protein [Murimonas intestini]|nr:flavodoxin domain-containing protein [Murimonas intestini]
MKKGIVIYNSKTGFTERYAKWICEELGYQMIPYKERDKADLSQYECVIFGGWAHAGSIKGFKWFKEKLPALEGKRIIVYATGATPPDSPEVEKAIEMNLKDLTGAQRERIRVFYFHGGLSYEKMGTVDRVLMSLFRKMLKKSGGESEAYRMVSHSFDCSSKEQTEPLLEYARALRKGRRWAPL